MEDKNTPTEVHEQLNRIFNRKDCGDDTTIALVKLILDNPHEISRLFRYGKAVDAAHGDVNVGDIKKMCDIA